MGFCNLGTHVCQQAPNSSSTPHTNQQACSQKEQRTAAPAVSNKHSQAVAPTNGRLCGKRWWKKVSEVTQQRF
jgi:hypothetical protein